MGIFSIKTIFFLAVYFMAQQLIAGPRGFERGKVDQEYSTERYREFSNLRTETFRRSTKFSLAVKDLVDVIYSGERSRIESAEQFLMTQFKDSNLWAEIMIQTIEGNVVLNQIGVDQREVIAGRWRLLESMLDFYLDQPFKVALPLESMMVLFRAGKQVDLYTAVQIVEGMRETALTAGEIDKIGVELLNELAVVVQNKIFQIQQVHSGVYLQISPTYTSLAVDFVRTRQIRDQEILAGRIDTLLKQLNGIQIRKVESVYSERNDFGALSAIKKRDFSPRKQEKQLSAQTLERLSMALEECKTVLKNNDITSDPKVLKKWQDRKKLLELLEEEILYIFLYQ